MFLIVRLFSLDGSNEWMECGVPVYPEGAEVNDGMMTSVAQKGDMEAIQYLLTLGVSREDLRTAMQSGQTLTQYATSLGKDPQTLVDALTNAANTKLDQLVADGTITQERADTVKGKVPARVDKLMNRQFGQHAAA